MQRKQIMICGTGGQGIILAGIILARAAVLDGYNVVMSQNYGPESRGGSSRCDIILSNSEIFYPEVTHADIFITLSQESFNKFNRYIGEDTYVIADKNIYTGVLQNVEKIDIIEYAYNIIKKPQTVNMLSLGIIMGKANIVSDLSMREAIKKSVPEKTISANMFAFDTGVQILKEKCFY